jgi:nitrogen fixation protein FixH
MTRHRQAPFDPRRGRWIPWVFVGGMAVVVAVNAVMVALALGSFSGVAVSRPYERGRGYAAVLAEAARQESQGWQVAMRVADGLLHVAVSDRDGAPVTGALEGVLQRPAERSSHPLALLAVAPGAWVAPLEGARPGQWEARLALAGPDGAAFDIRARVLLP